MKIKKIMLVTFVLLAILTIGAVSASDDVASDGNLTVSDDGGGIIDVSSDDELGEMDADDVDISVGDIDRTEDGYEDKPFTTVSVSQKEGNFVICTGEGESTVEVYRENLADSDRCSYDADEDSYVLGVSLNDINNYIALKIDSNKNLYDIFDESDRCFRFVLEYGSNDLVVDKYNVDVSDDNITFEYIDEEGPVVESNIYVNLEDNFDISNPDTVVIAITSDENLKGTFWIEMDDGDDSGPKFYYFDVHDSDELNITVFSLNIKEAQHYEFRVYYCPEGQSIDWDDETGNKDDFMVEEDLHAEGRNYSDFWYDAPHNINYFSTEPIITFYCADANEGTVVVKVYKYVDDGDEVLVGNYSKNIADNVDKFIYWNSTELGFEVGNGYGLNITCGDFSDVAECLFNNPVIFNEEVSYLENEDEERIKIVTIEIPSDLGGSILLSINGTPVELDTTMFDEENEHMTLSSLYWFHPWGYGDTVKAYVINNLNINDQFVFNEGIYNIAVTLSVDYDGRPSTVYSSQGNVTVFKPKSEEKDGIEIKFYDGQTYSVYEDEFCFAEIITPEEANGTVIVTIPGQDDPIFECDLSDFDEGSVVYPHDLNLKEGTYEITVAYWENGNQILNSTATISLDYGDEGIMRSHVPFTMKIGEHDFEIYFATNEVEGEVYIVIDGTEYYRKYIDSDSLEFDGEEGYWALHVSLEELDVEIQTGEYEKVQIFYNGTDGTQDVDVHNGLEIAPSIPSIWIADWPVSTQDDEVIMIYPNNDDSENIRVVLKIGDEVWLNATVEELGLRLKTDDDGRDYYGIPADLLNKTLEIGNIYHNVIAYYYSDNFNVTSVEDEYPNTRLIVDGMLDEVEYNYTGVVLAVFFSKDNGEIKIYIEGRDEPIVCDAVKNNFYTWTLNELGLSEGFNGDIDVEYGYDQFGGRLWVVNNEKFRAKSKYETLIIFQDDDVVSVYCPLESAGKTISLYCDEGNTLLKEYVIKDSDEGSYVGFSLDDLNITEPNWYGITVKVGDEQIGDEFGLQVRPLIEFNQNGIATLSDDDEDVESMIVANLYLPYYYEGDVVITVDGTPVDCDLDDLESEEWEYFMHYVIYSSDLEDIGEGKYNVGIALDDVSENSTILFAEKNIKSKDGVLIEMLPLNVTYADNNWDDYWNTYFAVITTDADWDTVNASVFLGETEYPIVFSEFDIWRDDIWDNGELIGYKYYIRPGNIKNEGEFSNLWGEFDVTVVYYDENGDEFLTNNGTLIINKMPNIQVIYTDWDERKAEYHLDDVDTDIFHIRYYDANTDFGSFRIVITSEGNTIIDDTLNNLVYESQTEDNGAYLIHVKVKNLENITFGHYDNVVATLYMGDYKTQSDEYEDACTSFDVYGPSSVTFAHNIVFVSGGNGTTTITLVGATVSEGENLTVDGHPEATVKLEGNTITVSGLTAGSYALKVITTPVNQYYSSVEMSLNITVSEGKIDPNFAIAIDNVEEGNPISVTVTANDLFSGDVIVDVKGNKILVSVNDGRGVNDTTGVILAPGSYDATISYEASETYNESFAQTSFNVTAKPIDPGFTIDDVSSVVEGNPVVIIIKANENFTGVVNVLIGENIVATAIITDGVGNATIPADKLAVGSVTVYVTSDAIDKFLAGKANTTLNVTAKPSNNNGGTSNNNGGTSTNNGGTSTTTTTTKKVTKITAKKKTFKAKKKVKKYTITLKSGKKAIKGAKVTLKVGKKTYKAKTNKKGKATFKITKLNKKGKYKAVIKFAGTKLYKASKKTVKITVKK